MLPAPHTYMYNACTTVHVVDTHKSTQYTFMDMIMTFMATTVIMHQCTVKYFTELTAKQKATINITTVHAHAQCVG